MDEDNFVLTYPLCKPITLYGIMTYMAIRKPKTPHNYLMKDLPDFDKISHLFSAIYKRPISLSEAREIQAIWNNLNPAPPTAEPEKLF